MKNKLSEYKKRIIAALVLLLALLAGCIVYYKTISDEYIGDITLEDEAFDNNRNSLALSAGDYILKLTFSAEEDFEMTLDGRDVNQAPLYYGLFSKGESQYFEIPFSTPVDDCRICINTTSPITIEQITVHSDKVIYRDSIYKTLLMFVLGLMGIAFCVSNKFIKASRVQQILWVSIGAAIIIQTYLHWFNHTGGGFDGTGLMGRLVGVSDALADGQFPATIYPYVFNGYGMPGIVYPTTFLYPAAILIKLHVSVFGAYQILFIMIGVLAAFIMYTSIKTITTSDISASLGTIFFVLFVYFFDDIYWRNAFCEIVSMIFMSLVIVGIYQLATTDKKTAWIWMVIGYTGVVNSHVVSYVLVALLSIMIAVSYIPYILKWDKIKQVLIAVGLTVLINCGLFVPMASFLAYGLSTSDMRVSLAQNGNTIAGLFDFTKFRPNMGKISILYLLVIVIAGIWWHVSGKKTAENRNQDNLQIGLMIRLGIIGCITAVFTLQAFPWGTLEKIGLIGFVNGYIQYAFRFYTICTVCISIAAAIGVEKIVMLIKQNETDKTDKTDKTKWISTCLILGITVLALATGLDYNVGKSDRKDFGRLYGGLDDLWNFEYLPSGTGQGNIQSTSIFSSNQDINVTLYQKNGTHILFQYFAPGEGEHIDFPLFYFPGYKAKYYTISNMDGVDIPVLRGEEGRIRVELPYSPDVSAIEIFYKGEWYYMVGYALSVIGIIVVVILGRARNNNIKGLGE